MATGSSAIVVVEHLRKSFGSAAALDDLSFTVAGGTVQALLGPNGAGKTTTINCLTTLVPPDGGRALVAGHDVVGAGPAVRASIAVTGQFAAVDEVLSGRENLVLFGRLLRLPKKAAVERAAELLERFGLTDAADRAAGKYSGGTRRRLDLAVSLMVPRPVLFLDEPTTGLDPRSRQALWEVVRELRDDGTTILLTTQYLEEADRLADRIGVIDRGRMIAEGTADELKARIGRMLCEIRVTEEGARAAAVRALDAAGLRPAADGETIVVPEAGPRLLAEIVRRLDDAGVEADDLGLRKPTLDEVFLALTGDGAADDGAAGDVVGARR